MSSALFQCSSARSQFPEEGVEDDDDDEEEDDAGVGAGTGAVTTAGIVMPKSRDH